MLNYRNKKAVFLLLLLVICVNNACIDKNEQGEILTDFDISGDEKQVVFSYSEGSKISIYTLDLDTEEISLVIKADDNWDYIKPQYFSDHQILYIKAKADDIFENEVCIYSTNNETEECFDLGEGILIDILISENHEKLFFTKASQYKRNSPIGIASPRGMDIFEYSFSEKRITKITDLNAYSIPNIERLVSDQLIFELHSIDNSGMYQYVAKDSLVSFNPINDPRNFKGRLGYGKPAYSAKSDELFFTAPYQIYKMNPEDRIAELVLDNRGINLIAGLKIFHKNETLLYTESFSSSFIILSLKSGEIKKFSIDF